MIDGSDPCEDKLVFLHMFLYCSGNRQVEENVQTGCAKLVFWGCSIPSALLSKGRPPEERDKGNTINVLWKLSRSKPKEYIKVN